MSVITDGETAYEYQWASDVEFDGIRLEVIANDGSVLFDVGVSELGKLTVSTFSSDVPVEAVLSAIEVAKSR